MKKEAQAALEFLTTYGWAFLVILIMIGALAYFGVLKPSKLLPDRCNFGTEIECQDYILTGGEAGAGSIKLRLKNNIGDTIATSAILSSTEKTAAFCSTPPAAITDWQSGMIKEITYTGCNFATDGMLKGDKGKVYFTITYYKLKTGDSYKHDVNGEVYASLQ